MAIVRWKQERVKVIPVTPRAGDDPLSGNSSVTLVPGYNEVHDGDWNNARNLVLDQIAEGIIEEKGTVKAPTKEEADNGGYPKLAKVTLKSLKMEEALEVIRGTAHVETLKKWQEKETREEVRLALIKAIEEAKLTYPSKEAPKVARRKLF